MVQSHSEIHEESRASTLWPPTMSNMICAAAKASALRASRLRNAPSLILFQLLSSTATVTGDRRPRLTLYTGPQCSLCDDAKVEISAAQKEAPAELALYNIRDDSLPDVHKWRRAYQYEIPVLHLEGKGETVQMANAALHMLKGKPSSQRSCGTGWTRPNSSRRSAKRNGNSSRQKRQRHDDKLCIVTPPQPAAHL